MTEGVGTVFGGSTAATPVYPNAKLAKQDRRPLSHRLPKNHAKIVVLANMHKNKPVEESCVRIAKAENTRLGAKLHVRRAPVENTEMPQPTTFVMTVGQVKHPCRNLNLCLIVLTVLLDIMAA